MFNYRMNFIKLIVRQHNLIKTYTKLSFLNKTYFNQIAEIHTRNYLQKYNANSLLNNDHPFFPILKRLKYKKVVKDQEESDDDLTDSDDEDDGISKSIIGHVSSLRTDAVLKAGLGISRNKVETYFYESRIRVNGRKIKKKSHKVENGDEIDVIKESVPMNESLLNISRIVLVSIRKNEDGDRLKIRMKRFKNLNVQNYVETWSNKND